MTCIVAMKDRGRVLVGADSAVSTGHATRLTTAPKIVQRGAYIFGAAGDAVMTQAVTTSLRLPEPPRRGDIGAHVVRHLTKAVAKAVAAHHIDPGGDHGHDDDKLSLTLLVAVRGRIFIQGDDGYVGEYEKPYIAIGCGSERAEGALAVLQRMVEARISVRQRVEIALDVASEDAAHVAPPFVFLRT